ncbi:hypothetical protein RAA17_23040 [Komagataeibacter rhaeticus]|nr:hypothetical protein [Komagataeibacter rhaeticus]
MNRGHTGRPAQCASGRKLGRWQAHRLCGGAGHALLRSEEKHGNSDTPQNLNALTNMMLQDMNQELENQIRTQPGQLAGHPAGTGQRGRPAA